MRGSHDKFKRPAQALIRVHPTHCVWRSAPALTRVHDAQSAAAEAHHGVDLLHCLQTLEQDGSLDAHLAPQHLCHLLELAALAGQELVQGRVQQAYGHVMAIHGVEQPQEVLHLVALELGQRIGTALGTVTRVAGCRIARADQACWGAAATRIDGLSGDLLVPCSSPGGVAAA